jgi:hypothetical protein
MFLAAGRKLWTFYPAESAGSLGPVFADSMDPVFRPGQLASIPSYTLGMLPRFMFLIQVEFFSSSRTTLSGEIESQMNY